MAIVLKPDSRATLDSLAEPAQISMKYKFPKDNPEKILLQLN
jgi:hypothetical protein